MEKIPQLRVEADHLPMVWEHSILSLMRFGTRSTKESYVTTKETDLIQECSMVMIIRRPFEEPMIHMGYEGVLSNLDEYVDDVIKGTKDYLIGKGYDYTYHKQLFEYEVNLTSVIYKKIDQIDQIIGKLTEAPMSNRAQAITWMPLRHYEVDGPPCLQRVWCKVVHDKLEMHTYWRSRDAYHAAFANTYALIHLQKLIADAVGVGVGQHVDTSDSYHVYGQHFPSVDKFIEATKKVPAHERWVSTERLKKLQK